MYKYRKLLSLVFVTLLVCSVFSPNFTYASTGWQGYGADDVYIRDTPSGKHLTTWSKNTPLTIVEQTGNWYKIEYYGGYAYTYKTHVIKGTPKPAYQAYGADDVYVRDMPNGKHLATWPEGTPYNVYAQNGNWMVINYGSGYAYVYQTHVTKTAPSDKVIYTGNTLTKLVVKGRPNDTASNLGTLAAGSSVQVVKDGSWLKVKYKTGYAYIKNNNYPIEQSMKFNGYGADSVYIRETPNGKHLTTWSKNTPLTVVGKVGNWYKIKYNGGYAYTYKTHVVKGTPKPAYQAYGADDVYVRDAPSGKHLATWPEGTPFNVYAQNGNWVVINYGSSYASIYKTHVTKTVPGEKIEFNGITRMQVSVKGQPSDTASTLGTLSKGVSVQVVRKDNWLKIKYKTGYAYIKNNDYPIEQSMKFNGYGADSVYIRETPNGKHLTTWSKNTPLTVVGKVGNWYKIKYNGGYAYTYKTHVVKGTPKPAYQAYGADDVYVRDAPSGKHLATWPEGTPFNVYAQNGNWIAISYGNGYAFVYNTHVTKTAPSEKILYTGNTLIKLDVKGQPNNTASTLGTLATGSLVQVVKEGSWLKIKYNTGYAYISSANHSVEKPVNYQGYGADDVYIRNTPSGKHLATWSKNTPITVVAQTGNYLKIKYNGGYAYTYNTHVVKGTPKPAYKAYGADDVYVRDTPSGKHLATWPEGTAYNVYAQNGSWMVINYGSGYAYVYKTHVTKTAPSESTLYTGKTTAKVSVKGKANSSSATLGTLSKGTKVEVVENGTWLKIKYKTGYAYIAGSYVQSSIVTNYKTSSYNYTIDQATAKQMSVAPQTDKHYVMFISAGAFDANGKTTISGSTGTVQSTYNVRGGPSTNDWIITTIGSGKKVTILNKVVNSSGTWYQIDFPTGWVNASPADVQYYLNPSNFQAGSTQYFQFLQLSSTANVNATEVNNKILAGQGILQGQADAFIQAAKQYNINEIYLISHAILETGHGTSDLATGKLKVNGKTVYNMYGIGALDSDPNKYGAQKAYNEGWFTPEAAIIGGAQFIANGYINNGQDTLYKMRWNPENPATHQYASDIGWAVKQTSEISSLYQLLTGYTLTYDVPNFR